MKQGNMTPLKSGETASDNADISNSPAVEVDNNKAIVEGVIEDPTIIEWSDQMGNREKSAYLLFIEGDNIVSFSGKSIPGICVVKGDKYTKQGKWSHTTYDIQLGQGIQSIDFKNGWNGGGFLEGIGDYFRSQTPNTWTELSTLLNISVPSLNKFLTDFNPKVVEQLNKVDEALEELEKQGGVESENEKICVSFGSPTNREIKEGFWETPKGIPGYEAQICLIDQGKGWVEGNIEVRGCLGTVLSAEHSKGMHGGYYAVSVSVIPGTETEILPFETSLEKSAKSSSLPKILFMAFNGDESLIKQFILNVKELDLSQIDENEISHGRNRKKSEIIRVSGNDDFFLRADPLDVFDYIWDKINNDTGNKRNTSNAIKEDKGGRGNNAFSGLADLMKK